MELTEESYLPIGTVVEFSNGALALIVAKLITSSPSNELYKYGGVVYPMGYLDANNLLFFNDDAIVKVRHEGYESEENDAYDQVLTELREKYDESLTKKSTK